MVKRTAITAAGIRAGEKAVICGSDVLVQNPDLVKIPRRPDCDELMQILKK